MRNNRAGMWIALAVAVSIAITASRHRATPSNDGISSMQRSASEGAQAASQQASTGSFFILAMSWAPNFCDDPSKHHSFSECDPNKHLGFIVHGLWSQDASGRPAPDCTSSSPLSQSTVNQLLQYIPDRGLIAHEWEKHLSCHFTPQTVVDAFRRATAAVRVPSGYQHLSAALDISPSKLEQDFATANGSTVQDFRVSCHAGKLVNLEACLSGDFKPTSCGAVRDCNSSSVTLDAVP